MMVSVGLDRVGCIHDYKEMLSRISVVNLSEPRPVTIDTTANAIWVHARNCLHQQNANSPPRDLLVRALNWRSVPGPRLSDFK